jgi:MATE family multidrug resistance protein
MNLRALGASASKAFLFDFLKVPMPSAMVTTESVHQAQPVGLWGDVRALLWLAFPIIATKVSHFAIGFTDFIFVSRLGTENTAAIIPCTMLLFTILCLGMGCVVSVQTFAAQALGRRTPHEASAYAWQTFYIAILCTLLVWPINRMMPAFWALIGHEPAVQQLEVAYTQAGLWCIGPGIIVSGLDAFFYGVQRPKVSLMSVLVAITFNAFAVWALVFGKLGLPAMGIRGAGIATILAWSVRASMLTSIFLSHEFQTKFRTRDNFRFDLEKLGGLIRVGGPTGIQWMLDVGSWFVFLAWIMAGYSTTTLAAANIVLEFMHTSFMPALGVGIAMSSLVGHAIGEGRRDLAMRRARAAMVVNGIYMTIMGIVFWLAARKLMGLFSSDSEVISAGAGMLLWAAVFQLWDAIGITYMNALRGAGDTRWAAVVVVLDCWVVFIFGGKMAACLLPAWGYHGPWMMCTVYIILLGIALYWRWNRGTWKSINLFRQEPDAEVLPVAELSHAP